MQRYDVASEDTKAYDMYYFICPLFAEDRDSAEILTLILIQIHTMTLHRCYWPLMNLELSPPAADTLRSQIQIH